MNWKKALLVIAGLGLALMLLVPAVVGLAVGASVIAAVESGVIEVVSETVSEVAVEADRLEIDVDVPRVTVTESESGRGREITRLDLPQVTITDLNSGHSREVTRLELPRVTITDMGQGRGQIIVNDPDGHTERFTIEATDHDRFWPTIITAPLSFLFRSITVVLALGMVGLGAWLLLRNRQPAAKKVDGE